MSFTGRWKVLSSPDFDDAYLRQQVDPYVELRQDGDRIEGQYHIGMQKGLLDGRVVSEDQIRFDYRGTVGIDQGGSVGTARLNGDRLMLTLVHYKGDELIFECQRSEESSADQRQRGS